MYEKHPVGTLISGENLWTMLPKNQERNTDQNKQLQNCTMVAVTRGSEKPNFILRTHENGQLSVTDADGKPYDFIVVAEDSNTPYEEIVSKFTGTWKNRQPYGASRAAGHGG